MEPVLPCTELEFTSFVGPIFPTVGLEDQVSLDTLWEIVQEWIAENWHDAAWHTIIGESLVPPIVTVNDLVAQVETIANSAFPGLNCWATPVEEDN